MKASNSKKPDETKGNPKKVTGRSRVDSNGYLYRRLDNGTTTVQNQKTGRTSYYKDDKGIIFNNTGGNISKAIGESFRSGKRSRVDINGVDYLGNRDNTLVPDKLKPRNTKVTSGTGTGSKKDMSSAISGLKTPKPTAPNPKKNKKQNTPSTPYRPMNKSKTV